MCFTLGYYNQVKDYLHPCLHKFINYYKDGNRFDLPLFHGCSKKNRNGTRKLIEYDQGYQCIVSTDKPIGEKLKINKITRYVTWTKDGYLFKNKGNFVYNYKLRGRNSGRLSAKADSIPEKAGRSHIRLGKKADSILLQSVKYFVSTIHKITVSAYFHEETFLSLCHIDH